MADHQQAKKRIRQIERRSAVNRTRVSRVRTYVKKVELALAAGDAATARKALDACEPVLMRGAQKRVMHANAAARKLSRLAKRVKALEA